VIIAGQSERPEDFDARGCAGPPRCEQAIDASELLDRQSIKRRNCSSTMTSVLAKGGSWRELFWASPSTSGHAPPPRNQILAPSAGRKTSAVFNPDAIGRHRNHATLPSSRYHLVSPCLKDVGFYSPHGELTDKPCFVAGVNRRQSIAPLASVSVCLACF